MNTNENTNFIPNEWLHTKKAHKQMPKVLRITLLGILSLLIVAAALYFIPKTTPVDVTVDAVKMDKDGKELGTLQLHITGQYREYLFRQSQLDLKIDDFGNYMHIQGFGFHTIDLPDRDFRMGSIVLGAYQVAENRMCTLYMVFTDDYDHFVICDGGSNNTEYAYVASVSGQFTAKEIVQSINSFYKTGITLPEK